MNHKLLFKQLTLNEEEQVVLAVQARRFPNVRDFILVFVLFKYFLMFLLAQSIHRVFRPQVYIITTQRVLIVEPEGILCEMPIGEIVKTRGGQGNLMIYGRRQRIWMNRLEAGWQFRDTLLNVQRKMA